ncbi:MAG TPA: class I lanthipeptide [Chitinophaga sp.]|uniref:class I lanthipeptide n=1 Tax=Chitinophaga sp. TaxID=1869181 RepID=UPI002B87DF46|nr:class I lanthipeptide [Chitinophaga sp.]HVI49291.1 class I lanthipeptide [Chitinophaga sp.]
MKKKKIALSKKLVLNKLTVAELQSSQQYALIGGATAVDPCPYTRVPTICASWGPLICC